MRTFWLLLAGTCVGIGMLGLILPLLPTTPFVLAGGFAAARGSPRFSAWLLAHPRFGPAIHDWRAHRAIPRRAKRIAVASLLASAIVVVIAFDSPAVHSVVMVILAAVGTYLWTRPEPPAGRRADLGQRPATPPALECAETAGDRP